MKATIRELRRIERQIRSELVRRILANASPYFYQSGFIKSRIGSTTEYTRLVKLSRTYKLADGDEVEAITEDGIICDSHCGAAMVIKFNDLSIKSLEKLVLISNRVLA